MRKIILVATLLALQSCGDRDSEPDSSVATTKIYRVAFDGVPRSIEPVEASNIYSAGLILATYETLFQYEYGLSTHVLSLGLASEWPTVSDDGTEITVRLNPDSRFADDALFANGVGRAVNAKDVAFSLLRHFDRSLNSQGKYLWRDLIVGIEDWEGDYSDPPDGIRVLNDREISFRLTRPSSQFLHTLTTAFSAIVPHEVVSTSDVDLRNQTIGSGPFKLRELNSARAVLEKNENYRRVFSTTTTSESGVEENQPVAEPNARTLPFVDSVLIEFVDDETARWISFQNGDLDAAVISDAFLDPMLVPRSGNTLSAPYSTQYSIHPYLAYEVIFFRFRMDDPAIGHASDERQNEFNRSLRCSIANSIDWEQRNKAFYGDDAVIYSSLIPPFLPEAELLLSGLGSESGGRQIPLLDFRTVLDQLPEISYGYTNSPRSRQNYDFFRSALVSLGYPQERIKGESYATFVDYLAGASDGKHQITLTSWGLDYSDSENILQLFYGPNRAPGANISNFFNAEYDRLYDEMRQIPQSPTRTAIVQQMVDILNSECAYSGSATRERVIITHSNVTGIPNHDASQIGRYFQYINLE